MNQTQLFEGANLSLTPVRPSKDAPTVAGWTYNLDVARRLDQDPARPTGINRVKKWFETMEEEVGKQNAFFFCIRLREQKLLVGLLRIWRISWSHGNAALDLTIADPAKRKMYAPESLELALRYAFEELNLYRLTAAVPSHDADSVSLYESAGFQREVTRRQAVFFGGRLWDEFMYGLLHSEWLSKTAEVA
jgi:RimJ/RimL family protein N-acetyltransferase